jgi:hypothetical protein
MNNKKVFLISLVVAVIAAAAVWYVVWNNNQNGVSSTSDIAVTKTTAEKPDDVLRVSSPSSGDEITGAFVIEGAANTPSDVVTVSIQDDKGTILLSDKVKVAGRTESFFGTYSTTIHYLTNHPQNNNIVLAVGGTPSDPPGSIFTVSMPLRINPSDEQLVKVFFANDKDNSEEACGKVSAVNRTILETENIPEKTMLALLDGPSGTEVSEEYFSHLPADVQLHEFTLENGVVRVDLSEEINSALYNSCQVENVKQQIVQTLNQLPEVNEVVISVDGENLD